MKSAYKFGALACGGLLMMLCLSAHSWAGVWSSMSYSGTETLKNVWGFSSNDVYAVGSDGIIVHYNGSAWTKMTSNTTRNLLAIWGSSAINVLAVGDDGTIYQYNGTNWLNRGTDTPYNLNAIWGASESDIFIVGESGVILRCEGTSCTSMSAITTFALYGVWGTSASDVYAVGGSGTILHYDGSDWSVMESGTTENIYAISGISSDDIFAAGSSGTILHYDGASWKSIAVATKKDFYAVAHISSKYAFAAGVEGKIFRYNGSTWSEENSTTSYLIQGMWTSPSHDVFGVGYKGTILVNKNLPPSASFSVVPSAGIVNETEFVVDASASQDTEDAAADLMVRWDWQNDGVWDTEYATKKTASHKYASTDNYTVVVEVKDSGGLLDTETRQITVATSTSPTALFSIEPDNIFIGTEITVDASESFDAQDSSGELQVRWDWENDGTWDTQFSTEKTATHKFTAAGSYLIRLEVKDTDDFTDSNTEEVVVRSPCLTASLLGADNPRLEALRQFRDQTLACTTTGRMLIQLYYEHEDEIVKLLEDHPALAAKARNLLDGMLVLIQ